MPDREKINTLADLRRANLRGGLAVTEPQVAPEIDNLADILDIIESQERQGTQESRDTPEEQEIRDMEEQGLLDESQDMPLAPPVAPESQESAADAVLRSIGLDSAAIALLHQHSAAIKTAEAADEKAKAAAAKAKHDKFVVLQEQIKARLTAKLPELLADLTPQILPDYSMNLKLLINAKGVDITQVGTPYTGAGNGGAGHQPGTPTSSKAAIPVTIAGFAYKSQRAACIDLCDPVTHTHKPLNHHCKNTLRAVCKSNGWSHTGLG